MTEIAFERYQWFALPPVPSPIVAASCAGCCSTDNDWIFVGDGTNAAIFNCANLSWSNVFSFGYVPGPIGGNSGQTWAMSHVYNGRFILIKLDGSIFRVMNLSGQVLYNYDGVYNRSMVTTYTQSDGNQWGWAPPYTVGGAGAVCFSIQGIPSLFCISFFSIRGISYVMNILFDVCTGKQKYQFQSSNTSGTFGQLGVDGWNITYGLPYYIAQSGRGVPFQPGSGLLLSNQLTQAITSATISPGFVTWGNENYNCQLMTFNDTLDFITMGGFFGSVASLGNQVKTAPTFGTQIFDGFLNYFGYELSKDLQSGEFNLPLTIAPPATIPAGYYNGEYMERPPGMVQNGQTYGFFLSDFSAGYYLGIGVSSYNVFTTINYTRSDDE